MHNSYTDKTYYYTNNYDDLIKNELKIDNWVFLSEYIVFDPYAKRKFIIKKHIFELINLRGIFYGGIGISDKCTNEIIDRWRFASGANIPYECANKTFRELQEKNSIAYEKFKTKYNVDIYPYIFNNITDNEILYCVKYCCNHDFLPNILSETDSFLEVEYLDLSEWRQSTPFERSSNAYLNCIDNYCSYIHNSQLCITIDCYNYNIMVNRKTGKFKNIDIEDLWPPNNFVPNICGVFDIGNSQFSAHYVLRNDYIWSTEIFNKSFDYYKDLLEILNMSKIHNKKKPIYCTDDYKNLPHRI